MIDLQRVLRLVKDLHAVRDPELLLLKGHLALERFLVAAVATRLKTDDEEVPKLKFGSLVELAFQGDDDRRYLLRLNDLRNSLAHEFDALETEQFRSVVRRFGLPWPNGSLERCIVLEELFLRAIQMTTLRQVEYQIPPEPDPEDLDFDMDYQEDLQSLEADAKERLAAHDATFEQIRSEDWDELVRLFRPGWRDQ